jgi:hypothetical protein
MIKHLGFTFFASAFIISIASIAQAVSSGPLPSGYVVLAEGQMRPLQGSVRARGSVRIIRDEIRMKDFIEFGNDFEVSSGVVLDIKTCGSIDAERTDLKACLSQAELRKLRGAHTVKIFDLDLVIDHAGARLSAPAGTP